MSYKDFSVKQENMIADSLGWHRVSGSGSRHTYPGDVESESWLGECKTHVEPSDRIIFKLNVWNKLFDEATSKFKYPVLFVDDGTQRQESTWCLLKTIPALFFSNSKCDCIKINKSSITFNHDDMYAYHKRCSSAVLNYMPYAYEVVVGDNTLYIMWFPDYINIVNRG